MKRIFIIVVAALVTLTTNAQISSSTSRIINTTVQREKYEVTYGKTYHHIYVGGLMTSLNLGKIDSYADETIKDTGLGKIEFGYTVGFPVSKQIPLFVEAGVNFSNPGFSHEMKHSDVIRMDYDSEYP